MNAVPNPSLLRRIAAWFDPRGRSINMFAFILNRITGLGLSLYLFLHLIMLGNLAAGEAAYDGFLQTVHHPLFIFGEVLVVTACLIHGLNGIRIALNSFGIAVRYQKALFIVLFLIALAGSLLFAIRMFTA